MERRANSHVLKIGVLRMSDPEGLAQFQYGQKVDVSCVMNVPSQAKQSIRRATRYPRKTVFLSEPRQMYACDSHGLEGI